MRAKAIMVLGTSSHVGKSLLTTALCRIFAHHGYRVAPFKSQNMSLNSAATIEGLEIGRAQALQAEAAGILPTVDMNPILLKPCGDMTSQIVVRGKIWGKLSARDYHQSRVKDLLPVVRDCYERLATEYEVIILEGAGSPAEINLKEQDIVNMRMAEMAGATCLLVGDIDRGGVFASILGTYELLEPQERQRIGGFIINKFRGDSTLLTPGVQVMEDRLHIPCLGILPYLSSLHLEEEDSLGLPSADKPEWSDDNDSNRPLRIAVVQLPSFSNFTDFDSLRNEPSVTLRFCSDAAELAAADVVILPGSKQTADDLDWMRSIAFDEALITYGRIGLVVGICGGMQMLGCGLIDPDGVERKEYAKGLALLPIDTVMQPTKITTLTKGRLKAEALFNHPATGVAVSGYEIHVGETVYHAESRPFADVDRTKDRYTTRHDDGCISADSRIFGTYLHGIFDDDGFRHLFIAAARQFHELSSAGEMVNWQHKRAGSLDRLSAAVTKSVDLRRIFSWVGLTYRQEDTSPYWEQH